MEQNNAILIIIDDHKKLASMQQHLEGNGYKVHAADGAREGLRQLRSFKEIDIIICKTIMPSMTGFDFRNRIRKKEEYRLIPFIFISDVTSSDEKAKAWELEISALLINPVSDTELLAVVNSSLRKYAHIKERSRQNIYQSGIRHDGFFIKEGSIYQKIKFEDVLWIESLSDYVVIKTQNSVHKIIFTMKQMEIRLPDNLFIRIHRSFIVPIKKIDRITPHSAIIKGEQLPIGSSYRSNLLSSINLI